MKTNSFTKFISLVDRADVTFLYTVEYPDAENGPYTHQTEYQVNFNNTKSVFEYSTLLEDTFNDLLYEIGSNSQLLKSIIEGSFIHLKKLLNEFLEPNQTIYEHILYSEDNESKIRIHPKSNIRIDNRSPLYVESEDFGKLGEREELYQYYALQIKYLQRFIDYIEESTNITTNKQGCSARESALIMHYLFQQMKHYDKYKQKANLISFMTGRNVDNIVKILRDPLPNIDKVKERKAFVKSLTEIKKHYKNIEMDSICDIIDKDLNVFK